jgi:GDP-L-fucose synthase
MDSDSKILIAGANGMVGSAIVRNLEEKGYTNIIKGTRDDVDFTNQEDTYKYFCFQEPEYVIIAAAKVGGILANSKYPADFIYENLMIQTNIINSAYDYGVRKLLFLGSSCIYPKFAKQPITEDQLLAGHLEETNDAYAIAKIAGIKMCQSYFKQHGFNAFSLMPTNLYGPNDNFGKINSHVLPALINKFQHAKEVKENYVVCWGDGTPRREFLHVDDLAEACYVSMQKYHEGDFINVGTGTDIEIRELATMIADVVGFTGDIIWDTSKPNGTPRKVLNVDKVKSLGWEPKISLYEGIKQTYEWYLENDRI